MKLKKIVSLALAGILAVSMLTACGDNGSSSSSENNGNNNTTSYTDTILAETKAATKLVLSTSTNDKLDKAVEYAAKNHYAKVTGNSIEYIASNGAYNTLAAKVMAATDVVYTTSSDGLADAVNGLSSDGTVYALYKVSRMVDDEYIENALVDLVDKLAADLKEDTDETTYDYTIRIAKADSLAGKEADRSQDTVVIGVAITVDQSKVTY